MTNNDTTAREARPTVDTRDYRASHMTAPRGRGVWMFRNADTADVIERCGAYGDVRQALPTGRWIVLP